MPTPEFSTPWAILEAHQVVRAKVDLYRHNTENKIEWKQVRLRQLLDELHHVETQIKMQRSARFLESVKECLQAVLKARPRPELLWLFCMEVDSQLDSRGCSVRRSLVLLHGLRLTAEREDRQARRPTVFSLEFFAKGRSEVSCAS